MLVRDGALVYEAYYRDYERTDLHRAYSVTKSVASALIGMAIDEGLLRGTDSTLAELLPEYFIGSARDSRVARITLEQVLTMTAGFAWNENPADTSNPLYRSPDWIRFVLDLPMLDEPGTRFVYNSGVSVLLSGILQRATGRTAAQYASERLFGPLAIDRLQWVDEAAPGLTNTGWGLRLRPLDMARFGLLYLRLGDWGGRRLLPEPWVRRSTSSLVGPAWEHYEYGYQWWRWPASTQTGIAPSTDIWFASGWGGQYIVLVPRYDMVVVFTAGNYDRPSDPRAMIRAVMSAVEG